MNDTAAHLLLVAGSYLIGSIPFGYLCGRLVRGIDIREHGSGNIGATNVGRVLGGRWGIAVLVLDCLKGLIPTGLLTPLLLSTANAGYLHWQVAAAVATIIGHMFPCWLGFRGGKGVATALGVVICLGGWSAAAAALTFALVFALSRIISLSSIIASLTFGALQMYFLRPNPFDSERWSLAAFSLLAPALIVFRHRSNIVRLWQGKEERYRVARPTAAAPTDEAPAPQS